MSELTNKIIENITSTEDFPKVLRDVAVALKSKGFFDNSNWCDELIQNFKDVIDVKVPYDNNISCITDNEHEISCSFIVDNNSKFNAKSKTSTTNPSGCQSITNDNMFDDSNDSFEIPETQPFPPTDHPNSDEHDSEGFVIMPDDGFVADISSQSQVLLQGTELGVQSPQPPEFDDSDTVDMEMSKLQWDDSAKDNDKNKSASVTPELDFDFLTKQATIRNVDIKPVNKANADLEPVTTETADPKPVTIPDHHSAITVENADPDFETQDLDFEPTLAKSIFEVLDSPQTSTLSKVSSSLGRNKLTKNSPVCKTDKYSTLAAPTNSKCGDGEELGIEKIDNRQPSANGKGVELKDDKSQRDDKLQLAGDAQTSQSDKIAKEDKSAGDAQITENSRAAEDDSPAVEKGQETAEEEQTKRSEHNEPVENLNECDDELPETQFFIKSVDDIENRTDVEVPEDQLFKKPTGPVVGETDKPKRVSDAINDDADNEDAIENLDETQLFFKPNASSTEEDDAYDVETQLLDVVGPDDQNQISLAENGADNDGNNKVNVINVDVANDKDFDEPRPKLRKRNRLIESSDEEDDAADKIDHEAATQKFVTRKMVAKKDGADGVDPNANDDHTHRVGADGADKEDDADDYEAQTQKFETKKPETPRRKRISALKGSEWEQLCDTANTNQANAVFKSVFDQCKDLRKVHGNDVSVASVANQSVAAEASTRQSSRSRVKVKHEESNDAEPIASKRQRIRLEPIIFKAPSDSTKASAKPDAKSREVKASKSSTKTSSKSDAPTAEVNTSKDSSKISSKSDAPPPEVKTSKDSSKASTKSNAPEVKVSKDSLKASLASSKQDETDENIDLNMPHTQVFVKASSTPKERTKPDLPQRQARAATTNQKLLKPKDVQPLTRAVRQSVTYSPKVANVNVKVSSDENENVDVKDNVFPNAKPKENDKQNSDNVPRLTRKRKAIESNDSSVKRQASDSNDSVASSSTSSRSPSLSRSTRNQNYSVMFTMVDPAPHKAILKKLNISIVAETDKCNALITDKMYRTSKFMCAVAAGKPIVSIEWINAMKVRKSMIDPFEYLLKDAAGEKKYHFKLAKTLDSVRKNGGLYQNHSVLVTPGTSPSPDILKDIIASSGGKYLKTSLSARKNDSVLCVSAEEDEKLVTQLKKKYANLKEITAEQFMQSIFQYKI